MKRILLFLATNLAIVVLLGIVLQLLGIERILAATAWTWTSAAAGVLRRGRLHRFVHLAGDVQVEAKR